MTEFKVGDRVRLKDDNSTWVIRKISESTKNCRIQPFSVERGAERGADFDNLEIITPIKYTDLTSQEKVIRKIAKLVAKTEALEEENFKLRVRRDRCKTNLKAVKNAIKPLIEFFKNAERHHDNNGDGYYKNTDLYGGQYKAWFEGAPINMRDLRAITQAIGEQDEIKS